MRFNLKLRFNMGGSRRKKRKAQEDRGGNDNDDSDSSSVADEKEKYTVYKVPNYTRQYPEDGGNFEYIVIYESADQLTVGDRDLMTLGTALKRQNKGIKRFKRINKFKIGAIFERPGLANLALNNSNCLKDLNLKASIPARSTETTGVIKNVPSYMSNKSIYDAIHSSRDVVSVRRFMRRVRDEDGNSVLQPTQAVALTFACPTLPDSVDINSWFFEVSPYTPPVIQCLKCLRYGHIGKFCKNTQKCSICTGDHHYKECKSDSNEAKCLNCKGNHIAISAQCPIKKSKIEDNKKAHTKVGFSALFNEKSFPPLNPKATSLNNNSSISHIQNILQSEEFISTLITSIIKIISANKSDSTPITSESVKSTLLESFSIKKPNSSNQSSSFNKNGSK